MSERKTCPACGESVRGDARYCCFCEHAFEGGTRTHHGALPVSGEKGELSFTRLGLALLILGSLIAAAALVLL